MVFNNFESHNEKAHLLTFLIPFSVTPFEYCQGESLFGANTTLRFLSNKERRPHIQSLWGAIVSG